MENSGVMDCNLLHNFNTKERSCNFTKEEINKLQILVEKYKHILMCKKTHGASTKQTETAWDNIRKEFNATGQIPRTSKQLKQKFENMKRSAKKEATRERQKMRRTGPPVRLPRLYRVSCTSLSCLPPGKPPALPPTSEDATDWLRSIMSTSISGNESVYDDDVIAPLVFKPKLDNNVIILTDADNATDNLSQLQNEVMDVEQPSITPFDCSTPHCSLRKPMAQPLRSKIQKKQADSIIKRALREQKQYILKELNEIEMDKIRSSILNQNELHRQLMQHNEDKHKLELEKLKLEIDILE